MSTTYTHPDYLSLLAGVLATPDDDTPRLILSDWLEERGESERAEFIKVQCELAQLPPESGWTAGIYGPRLRAEHERLRCRERELWTPRNYVNWVPLWLHQGSGTGIASLKIGVATVTGSVIGCGHLQFRCGFIESVTLTAAFWLQHADALRAVAPIREVTLTTWPLVVMQPYHRPDVTEQTFQCEWPGITFHWPQAIN